MPNSVCSTGYGHNAHGINIQNMRGLVKEKGQAEAQLPGGMRTCHAWKFEVEQSKRHNDFSGHLGTQLKQSNNTYRATAEAVVADGVGRVEMALKCKLGQVQMQTHALQNVLGAVNTEIAKLAHTQQHISSLQAHLQDKIGINRGRQQVRRDRPVRELTCDDVNRSLSRQEALLASLVQKLQRGTGLVAVDNGKLQDARQKLTHVLKDKMAALKVDEAVLNVAAPSDGTGPIVLNRPPTNNLLASLLSSAASPGSGKEAAGNGSSSSNIVRQATIGAARAACGSGLYPARWQKQTDQLLSEAEQVAVDAGRLRKAIKQLLQECLLASQAADRQVDAAVAIKLGSTGDLREQLSAQLQHVQEEIEVTKEHRDTLKESLHAKQVPLQNLEARLALRSTRPAAETVEDEVQAAMASEAAQLKAVATQLHARVDAAGQQIAHLTSVSAALLRHIADKDTALTLEEKVALMDGRKIAAVPPSPTVLSVASSVVSGYSGLGDSASQVSAPQSHVSAAPSRASAPANGSRLSRRAPSCAGSATSSAIMRIAVLEKELAAAKSESAQLRAMVDSSCRSQVSGSGGRGGV